MGVETVLKSKDLNAVFSKDFRIASVTSKLKAETVEKHFKNYIYINNYIGSLIMYFMDTTVIKC